jgi:predicted O-linked N-acetylglucosamine transferase (SPINDLY family)
LKAKPRQAAPGGGAISGKLRPLLAPLEKLVAQKRHAQVVEAAQGLLKTLPAHPYVLKALSFGLIGEANQAAAIPVLEQALRISGNDPELHNNLGICLSAVLRWDEAIACFDRALTLRGMDPQTWMNRGIAFCLMNRWEEGIPSLVKAIELHPGDYDEAIEWLASALLNAGRNEEAFACYLELCREDRENPGRLGALITARLRTCNWEGLLGAIESLRRLSDDFTRPAIGPWHALAVPGISAAELRRIAEAHSGLDPSANVSSSAPLLAKSPGRAATSGRIRVGYLSFDFRKSHPVAGVIPRVFELHDRSRVEVFGYSLAADDGSMERRRLEAACDHFIELRDLGIEATAQRIADDGIDILVDLQGWTTGGRPAVLAARAAPIQVNWMGYAGTMGSERLADYLLGDAIVTPPQHAGFYSEKIERLPHCYLPMDPAQAIGTTPARRDVGLPERGLVFCSLNSSYKFNPLVFDAWCRLLREIPESCLWLTRPPGSGAENLLREVAARGVETSRIVYAERVEARSDYLARLRLADLALDPFPYNSHSTGMDALWAGVPMVALLGETFAGRVGASMLTAAGLPECVARSGEEYLQLCVDLARHPDRLQALRQRLAATRDTSPLFDMLRFTRDLEEAYFRMQCGAAAGSAA